MAPGEIKVTPVQPTVIAVPIPVLPPPKDGGSKVTKRLFVCDGCFKYCVVEGGMNVHKVGRCPCLVPTTAY